MSLVLLAGCSSGIKYNIGFNKMSGFGIKEVEGGFTETTLEIVSSLQELKDLCLEWDNPAFKENSEYYSSELSKKMRSYDEAYFEEKILIVYSFVRSHHRETRIDSLEVNGEQLVINARYITRRGSFPDEVFNWLILIEVNKADVLGVTSVQIKHK